MIQDILPRYQETADGVKTAFTVPFDVLSPDYVIVYKDDSRQTSGYTIAGNVITFANPPVENTLVTIQRIVPIEWNNSNIGALSLETFNNIITQIVAEIQTVKEEVSRSVKTNPYEEDDGGSLSEYFIEQMRDALDILEQFQNLATSLAGLKAEIDQYIADASSVIVAYINNMVSDAIGEYNQNATSKINELNTRAAYLSGVADKTEFVYNNRERIAYFSAWPANRL